MKCSRLLALRTAVVLPGAFAEGVLAVLLPWSIAQAALGTSWLGILSSLLVVAAIVGSVLASPVSHRLGSWRMTVYAGVVSCLCIVCATVLWFVDLKLEAFLLALCAMAADGMADLGFSSRTPVIARMYKLSLVGFSGGNWLWGIVGLALGSSMAGWLISLNHIGALLIVLSVNSLVVAASVPKILPRDARHSQKQYGHWTAALSSALWTPQMIALTTCIVWLSFVYGPMDNLLIPAQLTSSHRDASIFGMLVTAGGLGLAVGLAMTQAKRAYSATSKMLILWFGIFAAVLQIVLVWWAPENWQLIVGTFITAAIFSPFLPMMESTLLLAVKAPSRTLVLAVVGTLASGADMLGTAATGWAINYAGVDRVLAGCALALSPLLAYLYFVRHSFKVR
jgi:hypothetical protein